MDSTRHNLIEQEANGNPLEPSDELKPSKQKNEAELHPQAEILNGDSATTKAEKIERHGASVKLEDDDEDFQEPRSKRAKLNHEPEATTAGLISPERRKGVAPIKQEYLVDASRTPHPDTHADDDNAEAAGKTDSRSGGDRGNQKKKSGGQNHSRQFGSSRDAIQLCGSRASVNELTPQSCRFGEGCKFEHDIRKYLKEGKRKDLETFNGTCPIWELKGKCWAGWRCRFAGSHSKEVEHADGKKELVLVENEDLKTTGNATEQDQEGLGVVNVVSAADKMSLGKKKFALPKSDKYMKWLDQRMKDEESGHQDGRAAYRDPPFKASEKRRIYYGPETPVLAPLTTQGNLPFRRLCVSLGAQVTWSEMAMGLPLIQGQKQEWALLKAHESEFTPPKYTPKNIVHEYDNSKDFKFGAQIAANKPWLALKTTEVLTSLCPRLRAIDLNCGCPIDLVFRQGAGSALLDGRAKLEKMLRGMNAISGEVPITVKIRMGTKDNQPTAEKLCRRLVLGGEEAQDTGEGPAGIAAITLHGRSRQQRYSRSADWEYIASCASLVNKLKSQRGDVTDTVREPDARDSSGSTTSSELPYFIGNGDILSHTDYNTHIAHSGVDSCMIARGALVKPWIFEEISSNQYLDKSASERLGYIEQFVRNGLEYWGSDEVGVGTTRRFLLEWLSFSCRYVPVGILEHLPPRLGDRPPAFRGRNELETLLSSANYKDWIKIR